MLKSLRKYFSGSQLLPKFVISLAFFCLLCIIFVYQIYLYGFAVGSYISLLIWSLYILCIPVAHGRFFIGTPLHYFTGRHYLPELFIWTLAASLNIFTFIFIPRVYQTSMLTYFLYRILITPRYWSLLLITLCGVWYRLMARSKLIPFSRNVHSLVRHLIFIGGSFLFFYLTHQEFILILNAHASR